LGNIAAEEASVLGHGTCAVGTLTEWTHTGPVVARIAAARGDGGVVAHFGRLMNVIVHLLFGSHPADTGCRSRLKMYDSVLNNRNGRPDSRCIVWLQSVESAESVYCIWWLPKELVSVVFRL
jgi:hypothetical protein